MKYKFDHEEIVCLAILAPFFTYCVYAFVALIYNAITYGVHMNI